MNADVVIVGSGPAGLTAAAELRRAGVESVVVLERESEPGGIPRHSDHTGYGLRDLRAVLTGPAYARRLVERATDEGVDLRTSTMVTGWDGERALMVTSPRGRERIEARAVVLATGARERPRSARRIPGDRPAGVLTTGQLQNLVHVQGRKVGQRAVVVGAELVSWSAVLTLREGGCRTALMTSTFERPEAYAAFAVPGRLALGVPVARRTEVVRVIGRERVTGVELRHLDTGARRVFACDTVVFTGDWIPDHELARSGGLDIDASHLGPIVDTALRTSAPGVFAAGNLLHPVDTADVAALDGRHVATQVRRHLEGEATPAAGVRILADEPFVWVAPGIVRPGDPAPARSRLLLWSSVHRAAPRIEVRQDGRVVTRTRVPWPVSPGRVFRVPSTVLDHIDPRGGDAFIGLA
jgi:thioredoxin reductase